MYAPAKRRSRLPLLCALGVIPAVLWSAWTLREREEAVARELDARLAAQQQRLAQAEADRAHLEALLREEPCAVAQALRADGTEPAPAR